MQTATKSPQPEESRVKFSMANGEMTEIPSQSRKFLTGPRIAACTFVTMVLSWLAVVDVSSEVEPSWMEKSIASTILGIKIRFTNPPKDLPIRQTPNDLLVGAEIYRVQCSFCHGTSDGAPAVLARSFSPRPPQFSSEPTRRPVWMNAYIIRHGIRWTAMPAFAEMPESDVWRIALFLEASAKSSGP
jgi:mono/diheme cytochrome c family protein